MNFAELRTRLNKITKEEKLEYFMAMARDVARRRNATTVIVRPREGEDLLRMANSRAQILGFTNLMEAGIRWLNEVTEANRRDPDRGATGLSQSQIARQRAAALESQILYLNRDQLYQILTTTKPRPSPEELNVVLDFIQRVLNEPANDVFLIPKVQAQALVWQARIASLSIPLQVTRDHLIVRCDTLIAQPLVQQTFEKPTVRMVRFRKKEK